MLIPASKLSWQRMAFWLISVPLAIVFAWGAQPSFVGNGNSLTVLTTAFSVLAGFLIALIALAADERILRGRTWRHDAAYLHIAAKELRFQRSMFELYLTVLSLAFVATLDLPIPMEGKVAIHRGVLFLAVMAGLLSFAMPWKLARRHLDRLQKLAQEHRSQAP